MYKNIGIRQQHVVCMLFQYGAAKILKLCILEARVMKSQVADTEHVLLAILKDKDNLAATVLEANHVNYQQVFEQLSLQPDISAGMGFTEDDDDEEWFISNKYVPL